MAETRFGHPWVMMGTAENEEECWHGTEQDEDLQCLDTSIPAIKKRLFFLTEWDVTREKG